MLQSPVASNLVSTNNNPTGTVNLVRMEPRFYDTVLVRAKVRCTTFVSSETIRVCLYVYVREPTKSRFLKVQGSETSFLIDSADRFAGPVDCAVLANQNYFFGLVQDASANTYPSIFSSSEIEPLPNVTSDTLPGVIPLQSIDRQLNAVRLPVIQYDSVAAEEVFQL